MSKEHTFVDDPVTVIERMPTRAELLRRRWRRFTIRHHRDPMLAEHGHAIDSLYVERFWLPVVGPTPLLLARNLARRADGATIDLEELAPEVGCKPDATAHSLDRLQRFGLLLATEACTVRVRQHLAPLTLRQFGALPPHLRVEHSLFVEPGT